MDKTEDYLRVKQLIEQNRHEEALHIAMQLLNENCNDATALYQVGIILMKQDHKGLAYNLFSRACKLNPNEPELWLQYSISHVDKPENWGKAEWCLKRSISLSREQNKSPDTALSNLAMLYYIKGDMRKARKYVSESLKEKPKNVHALSTLGFINLAEGRWQDAWQHYELMLGKGRREQYAYGDEPTWTGEKNKRLVVSGEQGIGDEIMYASCFNELIDNSKEVVIDCMPRLQGLFRRSFPKAFVYGQRWNKEVFWDEDHKPEAHVAMASLPSFYRKKDEDFHGKPYLIPDPDITAAVKGMLNELGNKPKIGIAWTGGTMRTRGYLRDRSLEELLPILREDAIWISLEYNDRDEEIVEFNKKRLVDIHTFHWLTKKGLDYDLTVALISQLDLVISVPTTAVQTAGGLGIETWVLVPKYTGWIFARDIYPWAASVKPLRQTPIKEIARRLREWLLTHTQISNEHSPTGLRAVT